MNGKSVDGPCFEKTRYSRDHRSPFVLGCGLQTGVLTNSVSVHFKMLPLILSLPPIHSSFSSSSFWVHKIRQVVKITPPFFPTFSPSLLPFNLTPLPSVYQRRNCNGTCRAAGSLSQDAPFAVAIGACILSSLVLPVSIDPDEDTGDSPMDSTDARFAVMGILSFIPYFNWMSWVFAWLDTGKRRYVIYALVYLTPYLSSNLSLSPEESWLPIASIVFCIIHIQLEASIRNGDLQGFQFFNEAVKHVLSATRRNNPSKDHQGMPEERKKREHQDLPSANEQSRDKIQGWEYLNEEEDKDETKQH